VEPSSYVDEHKRTLVGGKRRKCCKPGDGQEWLRSYGAQADPMVPETGTE
jgi:hypothetical protein